MDAVRFDDLHGKTALVTGGARGLGYSVAKALASQGCHVALLDVLPDVTDSAARLANVTSANTASGVTDVTSAESVQAAFESVTAELGTPQILVTAAGITVWNDTVDVSAEEWRRVMAVNVDGTFLALQAFARGLIERGLPGSAILVSSMSASIVNTPQHQASYSASKAAVAQLAKATAVEWASFGIRVNAISPGYFLSDMSRQFTDANPELAADWVARIPLGRMGEPADLDGLVSYLASDASSYLTAQNLVIDGGYTAI
jgi:sorbose reductase